MTRARLKFLHWFPGGFRDETYLAWERGYKWAAHERWQALLSPERLRSRLRAKDYRGIAADAVRIESRTNLLFSFEKMALRDAVRTTAGAQQFSTALAAFLHAERPDAASFTAWRDAVAALPRVQTRVLTWPVLTVFGFIARPDRHIFLKPNVTRRAAAAYGVEFTYAARPSWTTYESLLDFARQVRRDVRDLRPRDMIDIQSFIWVQGSDEYD